MTSEQSSPYRSWVTASGAPEEVLEAASGVCEAQARRLVEGVLRDLELNDRGWRVRSVLVSSLPPPPPPCSGLDVGEDLVVEIESEGPSVIGVYFTTSVTHESACVATAEQVQDHVLELEHGTPRPPCPEHPHPLTPRLVDNVPTWVCPRDPLHCSFPVSGT